jgi:hypothetical protein
MSKFMNPPQNIEDELHETLIRYYPDIEGNKNIHRSISYKPGSSALSRYSATVTYYHSQSSSRALFEYLENRENESIAGAVDMTGTIEASL